MFRFFKKKEKKNVPPSIYDINGALISPGDKVKSLRYEMGECMVILEGLHYYYVSSLTDDKKSYTKMIDAITGHQKVEKIDP